MSFSRLTYARAMELIRVSIDAEELPTDEQIASYCGFDDAAPVRSLLADLADRGEITMRGTGEARVITLGRQKSTVAPIPRPVPSVTKPVKSIEEGLAKIRAAVARGKAAVGPTPPPVVKTPAKSAPVARTDPTPISPPPAPIAPVADVEGERPTAPVAPHPVMAELAQIPPEVVAELSNPALEMVRMPTKGARARPAVAQRVKETRKQLNIHMPIETFLRLDEAAAAADLQTSSYARTLVIAGLDRPRIPAKVATAAMRAGVPVIQFAAEMMERGLAAYLVDQAREKAA